MIRKNSECVICNSFFFILFILTSSIGRPFHKALFTVQQFFPGNSTMYPLCFVLLIGLSFIYWKYKLLTSMLLLKNSLCMDKNDWKGWDLLILDIQYTKTLFEYIIFHQNGIFACFWVGWPLKHSKIYILYSWCMYFHGWERTILKSIFVFISIHSVINQNIIGNCYRLIKTSIFKGYEIWSIEIDSKSRCSVQWKQKRGIGLTTKQ